jgi:dTDP-4-amino-4,6-dideoxygalactose transaminase
MDTICLFMRVVAASTLYSSLGKNTRALLSIFSAAHRRFHLVGEYERRFAEAEGCRHAVATSMARVALFHVLNALGVKAGDPVLLTPVNIPEMLAVLESMRLTPVFVDFEPQSLFVDPKELDRRARESGAKVFLLTYMAGQIGDLAAVHALCRERGLTLIQDATQSGACFYDGKPLTAWADYTIFSTCELKFVHTYRGAMICTDGDEREEALRAAISRIGAAQGTAYLLGKWIADVGAWLVLHPVLFSLFFHRFRERIFVQDPLRDFTAPEPRRGARRVFASDYSRMRRRIPDQMIFRASNFEAALGLRALELLPRRVARHREIAQIYSRALRDTGFLPRSSPKAESSYWRYPLIFPDTHRAHVFLTHLRRQGVIVERTGLSLLSRQSPVAAHNIACTVFLPCHAGMSEADARRVAELALKAVATEAAGPLP